jgi:hypothetical protein
MYLILTAISPEQVVKHPFNLVQYPFGRFRFGIAGELGGRDNADVYQVGHVLFAVAIAQSAYNQDGRHVKVYHPVIVNLLNNAWVFDVGR